MNAAWEKSVSPDLDSITACMDECSQFLAESGVPDEAAFSAQLAIEEILTNTLKYGFGNEAPRPTIVHIECGEDHLQLTLSDDAHPFDPFSAPAPDLSLPVEERSVGGLGIHLVRNMMTSCTYSRDVGRNVVRLVKKWDA